MLEEFNTLLYSGMVVLFGLAFVRGGLMWPSEEEI